MDVVVDVERAGRGCNHKSNRTKYLINNPRKILFAAAVMLIGVVAACSPDQPGTSIAAPATLSQAPTATAVPPTPTALSYVSTGSTGGRTSLRCEQCRAVEVVEVTGPETVVTAEGPFRLYGVFVAPDEENCVAEATDRLAELVSGTLRVEAGSLATDSNGTPIRYLYTDSGDSIDELFISEGLARTSAFDGPHAPWLLITADKARRDRSGCIWENFDRLFPQRTPRASGGIN